MGGWRGHGGVEGDKPITPSLVNKSGYADGVCTQPQSQSRSHVHALLWVREECPPPVQLGDPWPDLLIILCGSVSMQLYEVMNSGREEARGKVREMRAKTPPSQGRLSWTSGCPLCRPVLRLGGQPGSWSNPTACMPTPRGRSDSRHGTQAPCSQEVTGLPGPRQKCRAPCLGPTCT